MKIIHTADWHLGHRLVNNDRHEEQQRALAWLSDLIATEQAEALIIAGDVFDTGTPSNQAQELYYRFLTGLTRTRCRHVVVVGGNHDSPSLLNAPRELLRLLRIHVVGNLDRQPDGSWGSLLIPLLHPETGAPEALVAPIPFLRDRELRSSVQGETAAEREAAIRNGIAEVYRQAGQQVQEWQSQHGAKLPTLATGHLYATGATTSGSELDIHVGNLGQVGADVFPEIFDYVALGHLHRPQTVGHQERIRYSGSLIPLGFGEVTDRKEVVITHYEPQGGLLHLSTHEIPRYRQLFRLTGTLSALLDQITQLPASGLTHWLELTVQGQTILSPADEQTLRQAAEQAGAEVLKLLLTSPEGTPKPMPDFRHMKEVNPREIFGIRLEKANITDPEEVAQLQALFDEILTDLQQNGE